MSRYEYTVWNIDGAAVAAGELTHRGSVSGLPHIVALGDGDWVMFRRETPAMVFVFECWVSPPDRGGYVRHTRNELEEWLTLTRYANAMEDEPARRGVEL